MEKDQPRPPGSWDKGFLKYLSLNEWSTQDLESGRLLFTNATVNAFALLGCIPFSIKRFLTGDYRLGILDGVMAILFTANFVYISKTGRHKGIGIFTSCIGFLFFGFLFGNGSKSHSGALWAILFPFLVSTLVGKRLGVFASGLFFVVLLAIVSVPAVAARFYQAHYDKDFLVVFFVVLVSVSILAYIVEHVRDRTQQRLEEANRALGEASMVDPLTGLKNRRFLDLCMPEELARMSRQRRAQSPQELSRAALNVDLLFFLVDLDHFKNVNDTFGHAAGDLVLRQASDALRGACREADIVVRWGGEEFLVVARNTDRSSARVMAVKLWKAIRDLTFDVGHGQTLSKTCSVGFCAFPVLEGCPDRHSWEEAVELADQCLYVAKQSGRDSWVGVLVPEEAREDGRLLLDLPGLAIEGRVQILTSYPPETALNWHKNDL